MRANVPTILETEDELRKRLLAESRKRLRTRILAMLMLKTGQQSTKEGVADALGVHRHTVARWLEKYRKGGIEELVTIRTRPNRKRVVPNTVMRRLEAELRENPEQFSSFRDVQAWIRAQFEMDVKYKTVYRLVRYELGIRIGNHTAAPAAVAPTDDDLRDRSAPGGSLAGILRSAARFINDNRSSPAEVSAAVDVLASIVRSNGSLTDTNRDRALTQVSRLQADLESGASSITETVESLRQLAGHVGADDLASESLAEAPTNLHAQRREADRPPSQPRRSTGSETGTGQRSAS